MPELPEIEAYRRMARVEVVGRTVGAVHAPDPWILKRGLGTEAVVGLLVGRTISAARRKGKLLMLDTAGGPVLGLRFGMTGRLVVDGTPAIDRLLYAPVALEPRWDRFGLDFTDGGSLRLSDPRRLGGVELDPDEERLGPDARSVTVAQLVAALRDSRTPLKARLLDQSAVSGIGNLVADETLWRAGLTPLRPAGSLDPAETAALARTIRSTVRMLERRGGSHTGDLGPHRVRGGRCPADGAPLERASVGGRTTWWCARHQR